MVDGSDGLVEERVRVAMNRLSGTLEDGAEAAPAGSRAHGDVLVDVDAKVIRDMMKE